MSIVPNLMGGEGHIIPYHISVTNALRVTGWEHIVLYSPEDNISPLPSNWYGVLKGNRLEQKHGLFKRIKLVFAFAYTLRSALYSLFQRHYNRQKIIFLERFIHLQLLGLFLALIFLPKQNVYLLIFCRINFHDFRTKWVYWLLNKLLKRIMSHRFALLCDSEILAESLANFFQEKVHLMPVTHPEFYNTKKPSGNQKILCWWAGSPREEKGWSIIRKLVENPPPEATRFCIVAAKSANFKTLEKGVELILTEDKLPRNEYLLWLERTDIMLLPYDAKAYAQRTSGIFVEAIVAGNIPLTTAGTWMAKELLKFGLQELIVSWDEPQLVWGRISTVVVCPKIRERLSVMQEVYRNLHSEANFNYSLEKILDTIQVNLSL
ncbi:MAG: hypothetical protein NZ901_03100 [Geminocystis sp.]|nr:hypothetical protein [Geminocystis sp.]MCS7147158.1 hypothetical protein [Geminocystis sp.]MDW8116154.1 hypothetical protein [Geminocystis sp.]MDW8462855.1 hypothetical protein [Geminocystis sp.]